MVLSVRFQALTISKAPEYLQEGGPKANCEFRVSSSAGGSTEVRRDRVLGARASRPQFRNPQSSIATIAIVLVEFAIEGFAANAECARGVSFVAVGVIERRFDRLTLNFVH